MSEWSMTIKWSGTADELQIWKDAFLLRLPNQTASDGPEAMSDIEWIKHRSLLWQLGIVQQGLEQTRDQSLPPVPMPNITTD